MQLSVMASHLYTYMHIHTHIHIHTANGFEVIRFILLQRKRSVLKMMTYSFLPYQSAGLLRKMQYHDIPSGLGVDPRAFHRTSKFLAGVCMHRV